MAPETMSAEGCSGAQFSTSLCPVLLCSYLELMSQDPGITKKQGTAILIGAGPAGLTAAIELQRGTAIKPILIEASQEIGGLSRTVRHRGNRMDIGGHRFFSKSDRVMKWWIDMLPVERGSSEGAELRYQGQQRGIPEPTVAPDPQTEDLVMLVRQRKSRINSGNASRYSLALAHNLPTRFALKRLPAGLQLPAHLADPRPGNPKPPSHLTGCVAERQGLGDPTIPSGQRMKPRGHVDPCCRYICRRGATVFD